MKSKMIKTKLDSSIAYVYTSNDISSVSA